ncbi:hypothetical protein A3709_13780 [Halioglobus sp. HI00S01]|uniref:sensor histidine kinase n=1 Tax=Halioglobus sp. HI00S01 TaxID=1822214 RepID=UPI0007C20D9A|nr:histidine kinase dimerization/phospho-acceptor domain-containing protein [Halioglobus sp. HI00S01]KZX59364.1 hypothetical protein A3709_13780 [Halioglobus sp. HI00S01]
MKASLQKRLFLVLGIFVLAITALWAGLSLMLAYVVEDEIIDRLLAGEVAQLQQTYVSSGVMAQPRLDEVAIYASLADVPVALQAHIEPGVGGEIFTPDDTHFHYRWVQLQGVPPMLLVAEVSPWLVVSRMSTSLFILLSAGLFMALLLSLVAAYVIAGITTRPLRELTAAIEQNPRPSPLPHVHQNDEVGVLATAMESALDGLQQALARESAFTHDVSHELRTPLTALRNAVVLLPASVANDAEVKQLVAASAEIENLLTTLVALARSESSLTTPLPMRALLEDVLLARSEVIEAKGLVLELNVDDEATAQGNEQLARLLIGNLVDNALHYAHPARLSIRYHAGLLELANPVGQGERAAHPASLGHGLSLVRRLASSQGWRFNTAEADNQYVARIAT